MAVGPRSCQGNAAWRSSLVVAKSLIVLGVLAGCTVDDGVSKAIRTPPTRPHTLPGTVVLLSPHHPQSGLPPEWVPWILHPSKARTHYASARADGEDAIRADAKAAASGLMRKLDIDPAQHPFLEWRWRVSALIPGADVTDRYAEDSPVRLVLAFEGDKSRLPVRDRLFFERARLLSGGQDMPYATLMYIWENQQPVSSVVHNPHTGRVRKIVVSSGADGVGRWQRYRRHIVEDYWRAYGEAPGRLVGIAILTDTDNTRESVTAHYGAIRLRDR